MNPWSTGLLPQGQALDIRHTIDVRLAQQAARELAVAIGFELRAQEELALVASELASNLLKHAGWGRLSLAPLAEHGEAGMQIESVDRGPGIANVEAALVDGFSTAGGLGHGMGTVNRMMDELDIESPLVGTVGARIRCKRTLRRRQPAAVCPFEFGAASRAHPAMSVNGDAFVVARAANSALVGVFDGVGHGEAAHSASQRARQYVEGHSGRPLEEVFRGVHRACRGGRGVVMALARFDWTRAEMTFASVGNIEARVLGGCERLSLPIRRGILGVTERPPKVVTHPWGGERTMILHSDGITSHWRWESFRHLARQSASRLAQGLLSALAKDSDDATVVVIRGLNGE